MSASARNESNALRQDHAAGGAGKQPFTVHQGLVAPLRRNHVDTDQIIPKQFLKRIERSGFGPFLFHDWKREPSFVLNQPQYAGASILVAGTNFGCGSSREHAAWALQDAGFDVVIAPSFGDIFRTNALQTGLLPVVLPAEDVRSLMAACGNGAELTVDLERLEVTAPDGRVLPFELGDFERMRLLEGLDDIGLTLRYEAEIAAYERSHAPRIETGALVS
jgi:3-isopropylmalate/(R)-2-methylmalate dehydratase small subunit